MKYILVILSLFTHIISFSQEKAPIEVSPELQKKIMVEVERETINLKQRLEKSKENPVQVEFAVDTFRIERCMSKWINSDYGDFGMRDAAYAAAKGYDSLLNKYYKKLFGVLKEEDRKTLLQAQKAWLAFRDSETKLVETISKDAYSGGGTMQQLTESSEYLNLIKSRTIVLFEHYVRATRNY